jgi:hypothetical protein
LEEGAREITLKNISKNVYKIFLRKKRNLEVGRETIYGFGEKMGQPSPITSKSSNFFKSPSSLNLYK